MTGNPSLAGRAAGVGLVIDEVFLGGHESQRRVAAALWGLSVVWIRVRCDVDVAVVREAYRADRVTGMAADQAERVHAGVAYDFEIDTTHRRSVECADEVAAFLLDRGAS